MLEYDPGIDPDPDLFDEEETIDEINAAALSYIESYIFNKRYLPAGELVYNGDIVISRKYCWESMRNAASLFYDGEVALAAYDAILSQTTNYLSFFEVEESINTKKSRIRVIQPNRIADFASEYFSTLNNAGR
jgi:hypothetical protein